MNTNIKFSILCPTYNHGRYISDFIESLINQTYSNFELIIVDDCSTDNTVDVIKQYDDERIKLLKKSYNKGINDSLNIAFENAKGEYCVFLASDDMALYDFLESVAKIIDNNPHKDVIYPALRVIDLEDTYDTAITKQSDYICSENLDKFVLLRKKFLGSNSLTSPGMVVKTDILNSVMPLDISMINFQDYQLHVKLLLKTDIYIMQEAKILYRYSDDGTSLSSKNNYTILREKFETNRLMDTFLDITDLNLLKKIFPNSANTFVDERLIPYYLGKEALKSTRYEKQIWGYNIIMNFISDNSKFDLLHQIEGFIFKDYLDLVSTANPNLKVQ